MKNIKCSTNQALVIALTLLAPSLCLGAGASTSDLDHAFMEAAQSNGIEVSWLRAMCWVESGHKVPKLKAIDGKAVMPSYGICQIQMQTAQYAGYTGSAKQLRTNNHINTYYAAKMLKKFLVKAKGNYRLAVSAYNRGHYKRTMRIAYVCKVLIALNEGR